MYHFLKARTGRLTGGLLAAAALAASAPALASAAPAIDRNQPAPTPNAQADPFYTPPSSIPVGAPGDVLRVRPAKAGPPTARNLANAWQIMYLSTDALGSPTVVTGTIMVPKKAADTTKIPLVVLAPGTTGPAFRCTVSRFINSGSFYEQAAVNDMLKAGYAVAVTDYEGYHENPKTTYVVGKSMGPAVLNIARAASRLPEAGLAASPKVAIRGFSQGGGASMWAGEMASTYAPELNIVGIAAGGVPAQLASVALSLDGKPAFGFGLNAVIGLDNAYDELNLENYLTPDGVSATAKMESSDCTIELLTGYEGKRFEDYADPSPFGEQVWLDRVEENFLGKTKINVPVFDYHATNDPIVPFRQASSLRDKYCALGVNITWKTLNTGHITTVGRGNADVAAFIAARLAGTPATPNC